MSPPASDLAKPVVFLAFANPHEEGPAYLRNLDDEIARLDTHWAKARDTFEVVTRYSATLDDLVNVFLEYQGRIVIFHYGGHADSGALLMESARRDPRLGAEEPSHEVGAVGINRFLARQHGLELVVLNGCATGKQAMALHEAGVPVVIGTAREVVDELALGFADTFHGALVAGRTLLDAFELAAGAGEAAASDDVRSAYREELVDTDATLDDWPWRLHAADAAAREWGLHRVGGDPLFALPSLAEDIGVPPEPFRYLHRFERDHARVFFGRDDEIRRAYEWVTRGGEGVLLLYGLSGVGKSSFLDAGLLPRLELEHECRYLRRNAKFGALGTLEAAVGRGGEGRTLEAAWQAIEEESGRPLVVVLDQVEEAFTHPRDEQPPAAEIEALVEALSAPFGAAGGLRGKLILGFRKEWLAELRARFETVGLAYGELFLRRLDRDGIVEVVRGIDARPELQQHYGLRVEADLPAVIAGDLLADPRAPLAPTLQILLTKMWESTRGDEESGRVFDGSLYGTLKKEAGGLLADFLDEQIQTLASRLPDVVETGLALDVLAHHVSSSGTARSRTRLELTAAYSHVGGALADLLDELRALHLLIVPPTQVDEGDSARSRLAHDTLAPLIRARREISRRPGQMLRRSLDFALAWGRDRGRLLLDERELAFVEDGRRGTRGLTGEEEQLIAESREKVEALGRLRRREESLTLAALGRESHLEGRLVSASALAWGALARKPTDEAHKLAHDIIATWKEWLYVLDRPGVTRAEFSPDGRYLVTLGAEGHVALWAAESGEPESALSGHRGEVLRAVFSRDGSRLMTAGGDGTVRSWSVPSGECLHEMGSAAQGPRTVTLSRDGERAATVSEDGRGVTVWSTLTGEAIQEVKTNDTVFGVALYPDGNTVLTLSLQQVMSAFDVESGARRPVERRDVPRDWFVEFSPDGRTVAMPHRDGVEVWDEWSHVIEAPDGPAAGAAFDAQGRRLVTVGRDGRAHLWEIDEEGVEALGALPHPDTVTSATFSADGRNVLTGCKDGAARLWDIDAREVVATFRTGARGATYATLDADEARVAMATTTAGPVFGVAVWATESVHPDRVLGVGETFDSRLGCGPGHVLLRSEAEALHLWSTGDGRLLGALEGGPEPITGAHATADGRRVLTWSERGGEVRVWSVAEGSVLCRLTAGGADPVRFGALSRDGGRAVLVPFDKVLPTCVFDLESGAVLAQSRDEGPQPTFDPSGRRVLSCVGAEARLLDVETGKALAVAGGAGELQSAAFSVAGDRILTVHAREAARVWSVESGELLLTMKHEHGVRDAVLSPDGRWVATTSMARTERGRIWSVPDGEVVAEMGREKELALQPSFSADGRRLLTRSQEMARVWAVDSGECVAVIPHRRGEFGYVAFTPDGERVVTAVQGGEVRIWSILDAEGLQALLRRRIPRGIREEFLPERLTVKEREVLRSGHPGWP